MTAETIIGRYEMQRLAEIVASKEPYAQTMSEQAYDEVCFVTHHLPRLVQMAEAHLSEPARLSAARAEGVREGIEMAARCVEGGRFLHDDAPPARWAREAAPAIRRLSPPPAEPTGGTAEPSAPVAEGE